MSNIADVAVTGKNLASMLRAVKAAEMEIELNKTGPFTVFALSEIATGKLTRASPGKGQGCCQRSGLLPDTVIPLN